MKMVLKNMLDYCDKYGMFVVGFDLKTLIFFLLFFAVLRDTRSRNKMNVKNGYGNKYE